MGVYHSLLAAAEAANLGSSLEGLRVLVQGLGAVGNRVAEMAAADGAVLSVSEVVSSRLAQWEDSAIMVPTKAVTSTACDVFVPCAMGGVIDENVAAGIECSAIAGAANNPLTNTMVADILAERGIVYAPDFISNGGGPSIWWAGRCWAGVRRRSPSELVPSVTPCGWCSRTHEPTTSAPNTPLVGSRSAGSRPALSPLSDASLPLPMGTDRSDR